LKSQERNLINNHPPSKSKGIFSDIKFFLINKPAIKTLIRFHSEPEKHSYGRRILQRIGIDVSNYSILNIHKIGIDAPVNSVFEELLSWNGDSTCWPNHIAKVDRIENRLESIQILPFGWHQYPFGFKKRFLGLKIIPLFNIKAIEIKRSPDQGDMDNARYMLFSCSGGYPIGVFTFYVRSSIADQNETEQTQLFLGVGFDFFGKKNWSRKHIIIRIWKIIHDRVSTNVMNRFKQLCEWRFNKLQEGGNIK